MGRRRHLDPPDAAPPAGAGAAASEEHAAMALRESAVLITPVVRWLLRSGVSYGALAELLKSVFVEVAREEIEASGTRATQSALSVLSGVHRKDVRAIESRPPGESTLSAPVRGVPLASQVFTRWLTDQRYRTRSGKPRSLPRSGSGISFETLARELSHDVHPRTVLEELLRLGLVRAEGDKLIPVRSSFVPSRELGELTSLFSANAADHLAAAVHNLTVDALPWLEQSVFAEGLSDASVARLHELARSAWAQAFAGMVDEASRRVEADDAVPSEQQRRMRFGAYFFSEPLVESRCGSAPVEPPPAAPRVRRGRPRRTP
jgi:hypothetical protein